MRTHTLEGPALTEAADWLEDCFEDLPADLTPAEITAGVARHYDGGLAAFLADVAELAVVIEEAAAIIRGEWDR